jgi:hypothetical protein
LLSVFVDEGVVLLPGATMFSLSGVAVACPTAGNTSPETNKAAIIPASIFIPYPHDILVN